MNKKYRGAICRQCQARKVARSRGLCFGCFYTPGVRDLYPVTSKYAPRKPQTEAELEAMIAAQVGTMPAGIRPLKLPTLPAAIRRGF